MTHHCHCCETDHTPESWETLPLLGTTEIGEWRNCPCGSTLVKAPEEASRAR